MVYKQKDEVQVIQKISNKRSKCCHRASGKINDQNLSDDRDLLKKS